MRLFIVNLDKVHERYGEDVQRFFYDEDNERIDRYEEFGRWFELPIEEIGREVYERLGCSEEFEVAEIDCCVEVDEDSIWEFNEDAILLEDYDLTGDQEIIINALLEEGEDLDDALERMDRYVVIADVDDMEELGKWLAEDMGLEVDYDLEDYVRWEDFADDNVRGDVYFYYGNAVMER